MKLEQSFPLWSAYKQEIALLCLVKASNLVSWEARVQGSMPIAQGWVCPRSRHTWPAKITPLRLVLFMWLGVRGGMLDCFPPISASAASFHAFPLGRREQQKITYFRIILVLENVYQPLISESLHICASIDVVYLQLFDNLWFKTCSHAIKRNCWVFLFSFYS